MKLTFFSNFFNSHQLPVALELAGNNAVDYTFVSLVKTDGVIGRSSLDFNYPFVIRAYESSESAELAMCHAIEDDVVIFGDMAGNEQYVKARAKTGRQFFRYAERLLKRGDWWRFAPPKMYRTWDRFGRYADSAMHVLCASAFTARDLALSGFPTEKCLKWGYFPEVSVRPRDQRVAANGLSLCSAQRLIPWKRVDLQIELVSRLKRDGYPCRLCIAGDGPERSNLEAMARRLNVDSQVQFLGSMSHEATLDLMGSNDVFLATSNRKEGWGATVNESMASGCCVIASDEMGSAPFLIKDGFNGLLFASEDSDSLYRSAKKLVVHPGRIGEMGERAQRTLRAEWSPREAAKRLVDFSLGLLQRKCVAYEDGPLSMAPEAI